MAFGEQTGFMALPNSRNPKQNGPEHSPRAVFISSRYEQFMYG